MESFPLLQSGAITQYPASVVATQPVQVIRFIDGTDQRCLARGRVLRQWQIQLNLLSDEEMAQLEAFFLSVIGDQQMFSFQDPFTNSVVPNCRLSSPEYAGTYLNLNQGATTLLIVETNG